MDRKHVIEAGEELHRNAQALQACKMLVEAYARGETKGGSVDWSDLDQAHEAALKALSKSEIKEIQERFAKKGGPAKQGS